MSEEVYEVVAQAARYWFLFLMALIVWRSYRWFVRDRRQRKKRLRLLPDAGFVGELVVLRGNDDLKPGAALPVACEGVLGSVRGADVCVPVRGVAKKHLWFTFDPDDGLYVEPFLHNKIEVDGEPVEGFRQHAFLSHGSRVVVGDATLRLRLFAGFEKAGEARADARDFADQPDDAPQSAPQSAPQLTPEQMQALLLQQAQWMAMLQARQGMPPNAASPQGAPVPDPLAYMQAAPSQVAPVPDSSVYMQAASPQGVPVPDLSAYTQAASPQGVPVPDLSVYTQGAPTTVVPPLSPETLADPIAAYRRPSNVPPPPLPTTDDAPAVDEAAELEADAFYTRQAEAEWNASLEFAHGAAAHDAADDGDNPTFAPGTTFYPPVMDDEPDGEAADDWAYAPYPQSDATFEDEGYTYPVYVEEPDKSLYVEPDEAETAKKLVWDRYLKGGKRG